MSRSDAPAIANRLHRSGAIDFNVEYAGRQANIYRNTKNASAKRLFARPTDDDSLSVCEAEPLFTPKRHKGNHYTSPDDVRNPIACMSCINGLPDSNGNTAIISHRGSIRGVLANHEEIRDRFFNEYHYTGIAVTKWSYARAGMQQQQFVATVGGLNTIYCDIACQAGDTIVVDMPLPNDLDRANALDRYDPSSGDNTHTHSWGFVKYTAKKGTPIEKQTLVVRPMPPLPATGTRHYDEIKKMRSSFVSRGQIVGQCVKGAKKGERIDIILAANAICGTVNMSDRI